MTVELSQTLPNLRAAPAAPPIRRSSPLRAYLLMLAPALLFAGFILLPVFGTIVGSLFDFGLTSPTWTFVGLDNYSQAIADPVFWLSLRNNLIIVFGSIITQIGFGTLLAAILDRGIRRGSTFFRTIVFAPMVISSVAVGLIWLMILDPNIGPLNKIVKFVGLTPPKLGWLGDPNLAIWMFLVVAAWQYTGFMMVLVLAGLQGVPNELYQAAALDGARGIRAFWYITLPSIRNILIVAVLITTIGAFKVFDLIYVTTQGGPANATQVLGTYIYLQAFMIGNMGYADAISVILLMIAVILGWLQLKYSPAGVMGRLLRFKVLAAAMYGFVAIYCLFVLLPMVWMVFAAFKTKREIFVDPLGLPDTLSFAAFGRSWSIGLGIFLLNSAMVTLLSVLLIVMVSGMAAYVLARSEYPWMRWIYLLVVVCFAVPVHAVLVPLYQELSAAGMLNSRLAIVLPYAAYGVPFTTVLFYAFFLDFPRELEDAARLDNCNRVQTFFALVILPLSGPALGSASIFQAVFIWNEFLLALLMLRVPDRKTLPVGIFELTSEFTADWPAVMAGLSIAIIPIITIFFLAQKYFVRSLAGLGK